MTRCLYYLCLSFFIIVLKISFSNCSNETDISNGSKGYNTSSSNFQILANPLVEIADNNTVTAYSMVDTGITKAVENHLLTTVAPNLEIQSSSTSVMRPTEATTPVPTTEIYANSENIFKNDYDNTEHPSVKEKTDIVISKDQTIFLHEHLEKLEDPNADGIIKKEENKIEEALKNQSSTVMEPKLIEHNYVNPAVVPVLKIPKPVVIDYEGHVPAYDSNAFKEQGISELQEKVESTLNKDGSYQSHESLSSEKELISKKRGSEVALPEPEQTETKDPLTALTSAVSNTNTESERTETQTQKAEPDIENDTSTPRIVPSTTNMVTNAEETTEYLDSKANTPEISSTSSSSTKQPSHANTTMSLTPTTSENNSTPISTNNQTFSTPSTPMPTLETSTTPPISESDIFGNRNNTVHQFFLDLRTHTILCLISLFIMLLTVATVCSIVLACALLLRFLWKGLVSVCGRVKKCYVKRKDSSRNVYESGSLFPTRCDVSVRPYLSNDHDMY